MSSLASFWGMHCTGYFGDRVEHNPRDQKGTAHAKDFKLKLKNSKTGWTSHHKKGQVENISLDKSVSVKVQGKITVNQKNDIGEINDRESQTLGKECARKEDTHDRSKVYGAREQGFPTAHTRKDVRGSWERRNIKNI